MIFVGKVTEDKSNEYVRFADCAYLSFKDDKLFDMTIPAKLQSYLACGAPIIVAASGESAEIVQKAHCGIAVERNPEMLCAAVKEMAGTSKEEHENMRANAREYFLENFTKSKVVDIFEEITFKKVKNNTLG